MFFIFILDKKTVELAGNLYLKFCDTKIKFLTMVFLFFKFFQARTAKSITSSFFDTIEIFFGPVFNKTFFAFFFPNFLINSKKTCLLLFPNAIPILFFR